MGGSRNFERPNVERTIFRNKKIAIVQSYERSSNSIFLFTKLFPFFFSYSNSQILFFFSILTLQFLIIFQICFFIYFLFVFLINKFCNYCKFSKFQKFNYENLIIFEIVKILEVCLLYNFNFIIIF